MTVPSTTLDFINQLKQTYPDKAETEPKDVGTPEYWMKMGVIDLIRKVESSITTETLRQVKA